MKVRIYPVENAFVVADDGGWAPGTYPTRQAAARAAWNMRDHGTPDELPEFYTVERRDDGRTIYRLIEESPCSTT